MPDDTIDKMRRLGVRLASPVQMAPNRHLRAPRSTDPRAMSIARDLLDPLWTLNGRPLPEVPRATGAGT